MYNASFDNNSLQWQLNLLCFCVVVVVVVGPSAIKMRNFIHFNVVVVVFVVVSVVATNCDWQKWKRESKTSKMWKLIVSYWVLNKTTNCSTLSLTLSLSASLRLSRSPSLLYNYYVSTKPQLVVALSLSLPLSRSMLDLAIHLLCICLQSRNKKPYLSQPTQSCWLVSWMSNL